MYYLQTLVFSEWINAMSQSGQHGQSNSPRENKEMLTYMGVTLGCEICCVTSPFHVSFTFSLHFSFFNVCIHVYFFIFHEIFVSPFQISVHKTKQKKIWCWWLFAPSSPPLPLCAPPAFSMKQCWAGSWKPRLRGSTRPQWADCSTASAQTWRRWTRKWVVVVVVVARVRSLSEWEWELKWSDLFVEVKVSWRVWGTVYVKREG